MIGSGGDSFVTVFTEGDIESKGDSEDEKRGHNEALGEDDGSKFSGKGW